MKMKKDYFKNYFTWVAIFFVALFTLQTEQADASHFRYGHLTWQKVQGTSATARFTLVNAFRRDGYFGSAPDGFPAVGDIITETIGGTVLFFGDFTNTSVLQYKVKAIDVTNNWLLAVALDVNSTTKETIDHAYPTATNGGAPWVAEINSCCRTGVEINNPNADYEVSTLVELASGNRSPVSSLPAIVNVTQSATSQFVVPGADADPNTVLTFRLATADEAGTGFNQPAGLTIDPLTGLVTWNSLGAVLGGLYSCQVIIEDRTGSSTAPVKTQVAVDFLIYITPQIFPCDVNVAPTFSVPPTPPSGTVFTVVEGQNVSFTVSANDPDAGNVVSLNSAGIPIGATSSAALPATGNPVSTNFSWTPAIGQAGAYVLTFSATDSCGLQALVSYTINVTPAAVQCSLVVTISNVKTSCFGTCDGSLTANAAKGLAPFAYLWSNGQTTKTISGLCKGPYTVTVTDSRGCTAVKSCAVSSPAAIKITVTQINVKCKGSCTGSLAANATGGSGTGYQYLWSNAETTKTISGLCAGPYTVTVTDSKGCTAVLTKTITEPAKVLAVSVSKTSCSVCLPNCNGTATANPTGGVSPYTYLWSNGQTTKKILSLCAATYTVTVTDKNGCNATCQTTIVGNCCTIAINPTISNNTNCTPCNGSISVSPTGGSGSYHYIWSTGSTSASVTALCSGNYTVTVYDNQSASCTASAVYHVSDNINQLIEPGFYVTNTCPGTCAGSIEITGLNGLAAGYLWSNGSTSSKIENLCANSTYTVTITYTNGCTSTHIHTVLANPAVTANCSVVNNESAAGAADGSLDGSASGGDGNFGYSWSNNATTEDISGLTAGTYTLVVTDGNGCTGTSNCSIITEENCNGDFTTYTQGGWGNTGAPGRYMAAHFENCFGSVVIGHPCGHTITLTDTNAVRDFLPQGSSPAALTQNYVDPGSGNITVLAGQVLGVEFALGFDDCDPDLSGSATDLGLQVYIKPNSPFLGWNIQAIYDTASRVLAGCPSNYTPAQVNVACTDINENYDEGADNGLFTCPGVIRYSVDNAAAMTTVYPNPFSESFTVQYEGNEAFTVTVTDVTGRVVGTYSGGVRKMEIGKGLKAGIYMVNLISESGYQSVSKVLKN
jgi:hypothetical protein